MGFFSKNFNKQNFFAVAIIVVLIFLMTQISALTIKVGNFSDTNSAMIKEIGMVREVNMAFGNDLNELRKFLLLPTKEYFKYEEENSENNSNDSNTDKVQLQLFKYVDFLGNKESKTATIIKNTELLKQLNDSVSLKAFLETGGLFNKGFTDSDIASYLSFGTENDEFLKYYFDKEEVQMFYKTPFEKVEREFIDVSEIEKFTIEFLNNNKDRIYEKLGEIKEFKDGISLSLEKVEIKDYMNSQKFSFSPKKQDGLKSMIDILNSEGEKIAEIISDESDMKIYLNDLSNLNNKVIVTELSNSLLPFLQKLNGLSGIILEVEKSKEKIETLISDKGFQLSLKENNLSISEKASEDDKRIYFKISDINGKHLSSIAIEKSTGVINIINPDGTSSENLLFFDPEEKKKTIEIPENIPNYSDDAVSEAGTFNILVAGKHGNLIDTMIFTHVDEKARKIKMISIPRDLYYNGRKINSFGYFYGMDELKKALSEMTGYKLDKFILIDMYAFIDVIDLIGGIDITLKKAVIDPTYKTIDNGKIGTLHYEPGDYHLGGKEALRLARTRHTSSDFARAERQQMILQALQNKAQNFGFGDADTFYKIAKSVLAKTTTDVGFEEAIAYYFKYQGFEIVSNNVMSSGNVLYVPPYTTKEQCQSKIAAAQANGSAIPNCMNENQAYTLLPKNNNWNVIKWFFRENFEENKA